MDATPSVLDRQWSLVQPHRAESGEGSQAAPGVVLDISRLLARGRKVAPSGIDRVELAYARRWVAMPEDRCVFVAGALSGAWSVLPRHAVEELVAALSISWCGTPAAPLPPWFPHGPFAAGREGQGEGRGEAGAEDWQDRWESQEEMQAGMQREAQRDAERIASRLRLLAGLGLGAGQLAPRLGRLGARRVFLLVSHRALERPGPIQAMRARGCAFVPLIHDLIPATHPEYARPGQSARHLRRIDTTARLADGVIVNSTDTAEVLAPHLRVRPVPPPVIVAPLGIETTGTAAVGGMDQGVATQGATIRRTTAQGAGAWPLRHAATAERPGGPAPYFVTLGTIEPRKNHLLLLHLWRDFVRAGAAGLGGPVPRLLIIGRRGWENENIIDILERSAVLRGTVEELGQISDTRMAALLRGARALLFPSFVEGYGLPLAEALALGVPAICSDLPALREVGGPVPHYLDPLDGAGWRAAILDYARPGSAARAAQAARLQNWRPPGWDSHFRQVDAMLEHVTRPQPGGGSAATPSPPAFRRWSGWRRAATPEISSASGKTSWVPLATHGYAT
ncbi:glycosyltransferase family 4 protein [Roseomonas gilardii]|uniref:glycosyltransferase family 4 protein n=1 Tax=Roseomonas gilardii TaxID=257708 RepID=UPI00048859A1|nr:glycosyltransferase family 1 protein [Roseomonas gilardii]SUE42950.1 GDP-mannose-dependent alpha-(1-2)-phosphatidylinositol mannosyltransferase [Roseomonas gilardii subsp. rosea]